MAGSVTIKQTITQAAIEVTKAAVAAITVGSEGSDRSATGIRQANKGEVLTVKTEGHSLRKHYSTGQPKKKKKNRTWNTFWDGVNDTFLTKHYEINEEEKVPIIKNLLSREVSNWYNH